MKKVLLPLLGILLMAGCEKESNTPAGPEADQALDLRAGKVTVCHQTGSVTNPYEIIEIADQAWVNAHMDHGDFLLPTWYADADGDGFGDPHTSTTDCVQPEGYVADNTDCDDTEATVYPGAEEICGDGLDNDCDGDVDAADSDCPTSCVEGEVEINFNGPLFVAPADEPGSYTWQEAIDKCDEKDTDGCDWYLPSLDELNALYVHREAIGGFTTSVTGDYWSSTEFDGTGAYAKSFTFGYPFLGSKNNEYFRCRCVRR